MSTGGVGTGGEATRLPQKEPTDLTKSLTLKAVPRSMAQATTLTGIIHQGKPDHLSVYTTPIVASGTFTRQYVMPQVQVPLANSVLSDKSYQVARLAVPPANQMFAQLQSTKSIQPTTIRTPQNTGTPQHIGTPQHTGTPPAAHQNRQVLKPSGLPPTPRPTRLPQTAHQPTLTLGSPSVGARMPVTRLAPPAPRAITPQGPPQGQQVIRQTHLLTKQILQQQPEMYDSSAQRPYGGTSIQISVQPPLRMMQNKTTKVVATKVVPTQHQKPVTAAVPTVNTVIRAPQNKVLQQPVIRTAVSAGITDILRTPKMPTSQQPPAPITLTKPIAYSQQRLPAKVTVSQSACTPVYISKAPPGGARLPAVVTRYPDPPTDRIQSQTDLLQMLYQHQMNQFHQQQQRVLPDPPPSTQAAAVMEPPPSTTSQSASPLRSSNCPSILQRKRNADGIVVTRRQDPVTSPKQLDNENSQSSTDTASSAHSTPLKSDQARENGSLSDLSPRKKPRKQLLQANTEESTAPELEPGQKEDDSESQRKNSQVITEFINTVTALKQKELQTIKDEPHTEVPEEIVDAEGHRWVRERKPRQQLLHHYPTHWKTKNNHFLRYQDVKPKEERKPTVNELANQRSIQSKVCGWKLYHLASQLEDLMNIEECAMNTLTDLQEAIAPKSKTSMEDVIGMVHEVSQGNIQRCRVFMDQLTESKNNLLKILDHKPRINDIIQKHHSKRPVKKKER